MNVLERNFFTDPVVLQDPLPYYAALRERGPVWQEPYKGVFMISGLEEVSAVYADHERFSAIVAPLGPLVPLPQPEPGESWATLIERRRSDIPFGDQIVSLDPPRHTRLRALLGKLLTPNRLKENEEFMWTLAAGLVDEFAQRGQVEFIGAYARPFTLLVIADLLGVPRADHETFRGWLGGEAGNAGDPQGRMQGDQVFANLHPYFARYVEERRAAPPQAFAQRAAGERSPSGEDVLSQLANVRFPDGELPEVDDVVRLATILFAAGQETTARVITAGMRILAEQPELADALRRDPEAIANFVEECLRLEGPIKGSFRLALRDLTLAGVAIPEGSIVMALVGAANRDARVFADPDRFDARRVNARRNVAFGYGEHFCPGASLARAEARISFERLLGRLDGLALVDASALCYAETFIIRGLCDLPLRFRRRP